jgi:glycosidase
MFEISTRWLYGLSQKYGYNITLLSDIPVQEFKAIKSAGFDVVWMMGVWQLGQYGLHHDRTDPGLLQDYAQILPGYTLADIIGSPYAVTEYSTNDELGSDADLTTLRKTLHGLELALMLDFVPNHSAVDSPWTQHLDWYVRAPRGSNPPYDANKYLPNGIAFGSPGWGQPWTDTAQFNYWNPEFVTHQINVLLKIASFADYIRCDMAFLLLNSQISANWAWTLNTWGYTQPSDEFWHAAIQQVKQQYPQLKFLAEVYDPWTQELQDNGFDFTYDKTLYDHLAAGNLDDIRGYITSRSLAYHQHTARFVENHDEPRAASYFGSNWRADAAALVTMTLPGMRFYFQGQRDGYRNKLDVHLRRAAPESAVSAVQQMYAQLTAITAHEVFQGQWQYQNVFGTSTAWRLMAWTWSTNDHKRLVVVNYSDTQGEGRVILSDAAPVNGNDTIAVTELFSGITYYRSAKDLRTNGLYVIVNQWWAQIFSY